LINHSLTNGGEVIFGPDGFLYLGLGDGGFATTSHPPLGRRQWLGSVDSSRQILRIDVSGGSDAIPPDNPLLVARVRGNYATLRNPWRMSLTLAGSRSHRG
jgi:hypothetical protein